LKKWKMRYAMKTQRVKAETLYSKIEQLAHRHASLMEVCGTHTMAIGRFGIRSRLPENLRLISGPGCPVCVTPCAIIDYAVAMSREPGVSIMTFGDMMRVPGTDSTLDRERAEGRDIHIVYSPMDALHYAEKHPTRVVVFIGIGFETTSPTVAATLVRAMEQRITNFHVLPAFKCIPPAMALLAGDGHANIDGFICPGHVSAVIGSEAYRPIAHDMGVPCVVTGFEALDILEGVDMLLTQINEGRSDVEIQYRRAVPANGNPAALALLHRVFRTTDCEWRGIGSIANSGLELSEEFHVFDACVRVPVAVSTKQDLPDGCSCGDVMKGLKIPTSCPLFGNACVPNHPVGPCMVSSEGACAAYHCYGG
jgi:hydrogenase expression/formation protein HypD